MIACVYIPDFIVALEQRRAPSSLPLVVTHTPNKQRKVYAACDTAKAKGVVWGMAEGRARAVCPDARYISANPSYYRLNQHTLIDLLLTFSDRLEVERYQAALTIWLDLGKLPPTTIRQLAETIIATMIANTPFCPSIGLASGKFAARIAATKAAQGGMVNIPEGMEMAYVGAFPLNRLAVPKAQLRHFELLGLVTLGQLGKLPFSAVKKRFKKIGADLHRRANGHDTKQLQSYNVPKREHQAYYFDDPLTDSLIIECILKELATTLSKRLDERNLVGSDIALVLHSEDKHRTEQTITLREPIAEGRALTRALLRLFKKTSLESGVVGLEVLLDNLDCPTPKQLDFFGELMGKSYSVQDLWRSLEVRHGDEPFRCARLAERSPYLPEFRVVIESVTTI